MSLSEQDEILVLKKKIKFLEKENNRLRREVGKLNHIIASSEKKEELDDKQGHESPFVECQKCNQCTAKILELETRNGPKKYLICKNCNNSTIKIGRSDNHVQPMGATGQ